MTLQCPSCAAENPSSARFCRTCGKPISGAVSATPVSPLMTKWRGLKRDLTRNEVRRLLGEPLRVDHPSPPPDDSLETWTYEYVSDNKASPGATGIVRFTADEGRLRSWSEPDWKALI